MLTLLLGALGLTGGGIGIAMLLGGGPWMLALARTALGFLGSLNVWQLGCLGLALFAFVQTQPNRASSSSTSRPARHRARVGLWDVNVALNQLVDPGGIICVGAKWAARARCCSTPIGATGIRRCSKASTRCSRSRCRSHL
jgi:hypothetical protein